MRLWTCVFLLALGCASQPEGIAAMGTPVASAPAAASPAASPVASPVAKKMESLVLLTAQPPSLSEADVDAAVVRAITTAVRLPDFPSEPPGFSRGYDAEGTLLVVNVVPEPYFQDAAKTASAVTDAQVRKALEDHRGWISVDVLEAAPALTPEDRYQRIGRVAAEFAGGAALLVDPASGGVIAVSPEVGTALRGPDPLSAFEGPDAALEAAMAEARERWPEFVKAFGSRKPGQDFAVQAGFVEKDRIEHMWVDVEAIEGESIQGKLATKPTHVQGLQQGQSLVVKLGQVEDWIVVAEGRTVAGDFIRKAMGGGR